MNFQNKSIKTFLTDFIAFNKVKMVTENVQVHTFYGWGVLA